MKKFLAAMLVASFGAGLIAQTLVYDYKASIKRIDAKYSIKKIDKVQWVTESYAVASDTISGYVTLPACVACNADGTLTSMDSAEFAGYAYLVRKGDKFAKKSGLPFVLKTDAYANAAIFGAYIQIVNGGDNAPLADIRAANKAWMWLDYLLPQTTAFDVIDSQLVVKKAASIALGYGFLGLDYTGTEEPVYHTGFGTAKILSWFEAADLGWCEMEEDIEGSCQYVASISGTLVGYPQYQGPCDLTPMWDVCYDGDQIVNDAVISGTWTLKYNKSLSTAAEASKEAAILGKLKAEADDVNDISTK